VKLLCVGVALLGNCYLAVHVHAHQVISCRSPDGKFALRHVHADQQPYAGDTAIIEVATGKTVAPLDSNWSIGELKLLWSRDSQRVSYFADNTHSTENAGGCSTRVFFRNGSTFEEVKLPELPSPQLPDIPKADPSNSETTKRVEPIRWLESGDLLLESELQNKPGARTALQITLRFEGNKQPVLRKSEPEKMSILNYFCCYRRTLLKVQRIPG
jgi:hypothetical protein